MSIVRHDPEAVAQFHEALETGDFELQHYGAPVAAYFLIGMAANGSAYLAIHGVTGYQHASFHGFMVAAVGGGFGGSVVALGPGRFLYTFLASKLTLAADMAAAWFDNYYVPHNQDDGSNNR